MYARFEAASILCSILLLNPFGKTGKLGGSGKVSKSCRKHTKSPEIVLISGLNVGAAARIRTGDLILTNRLLLFTGSIC